VRDGNSSSAIAALSGRETVRRCARSVHLVIPSLPGFGFSGPVSEAGWDTTRIASAWAELMSRRGYERYGLQAATRRPEVAACRP